MSRTEQMTNDADGECLRAEVQDDATIVVEWSPCDADGYPTDFGWLELVRINPDGERTYADDGEGETWTEDRTATVNALLRMIA